MAPSDGPASTSALDGPLRPRERRFSLATILGGMTLLAVSLAVLRLAPCSGLFLAILVTPAVVRTMMAADGCRLAGQSMSRDEWMQTLIWSFLMTYLAASAGMLAFMMSAAFQNAAANPIQPGAPPPAAGQATMWTAGAIAVAVGGLIFWIARPRQQ